jgi:hypothetical protein
MNLRIPSSHLQSCELHLASFSSTCVPPITYAWNATLVNTYTSRPAPLKLQLSLLNIPSVLTLNVTIRQHQAAMAIGKGFVLHTDFTTHPDQFPPIGTIIQDPERPVTGERLSTLAKEPATRTHEDEYQTTTSSSSGVRADAWVKFCDQFNVKAAIGVSHENAAAFKTQRLETKRYELYPNATDATSRAQEPSVKTRMDSWGRHGSHPVFIVTGIKIARGFRHVNLKVDKRHIEAGGGIKLAEQATAGAHAGASSGATNYQAVQAAPGRENDIVYAYELATIARKGWFSKEVGISLREPRGGFSSADATGIDDDDVVSIAPTLFEDLDRVAEENRTDVQEHVAVELTYLDEDGVEKKVQEEVFCATYDDNVEKVA